MVDKPKTSTAPIRRPAAVRGSLDTAIAGHRNPLRVTGFFDCGSPEFLTILRRCHGRTARPTGAIFGTRATPATPSESLKLRDSRSKMNFFKHPVFHIFAGHRFSVLFSTKIPTAGTRERLLRSHRDFTARCTPASRINHASFKEIEPVIFE